MGIRIRRRGEALEQAIYRAVLEELTTAGYAGLTIEGVAKRAQTGKAALYRRWPGKKELVLDALLRVLPDPRDVALSGSVRDNLLAALTIMADTLAGQGVYPEFGVMAQLLHKPEIREAFGARVLQPRLRLIQTILREAGMRDDPIVARTGPALVLLEFLLAGKAPSRAHLTRIVDAVLMAPLEHCPQTPDAAGGGPAAPEDIGG